MGVRWADESHTTTSTLRKLMIEVMRWGNYGEEHVNPYILASDQAVLQRVLQLCDDFDVDLLKEFVEAITLGSAGEFNDACSHDLQRRLLEDEGGDSYPNPADGSSTFPTQQALRQAIWQRGNIHEGDSELRKERVGVIKALQKFSYESWGGRYRNRKSRR